VLARDETRDALEPPPGKDALAFIFLPRDTEGLEVDQDWTAFGQRATISGTTVLSDVAVRPEWVLRLPEREQADTFAAFAQVLHAAVDVGIARGALEEAARHLGTRSRVWFEADVERYGLDRHWRNARTHTLHDPTRWKHVHLGRHLLDGVIPPPDNYLI
jgi:alkylation response protein AidB-like acyl-CoA dehydrogenase